MRIVPSFVFLLAMMRVKPWAERGRFRRFRSSVFGTRSSNAHWMRASGSGSRAMASCRIVSGVCSGTGIPQCGQKSWAWCPKRSFRWSFNSVIVPTVEREVRMAPSWSIAIAGGRLRRRPPLDGSCGPETDAHRD